jgi:Tol biopolymer transport system component
VTELPGANWAPYFHPSDEKIVFSTNHHTLDEGGREFDIFMVNLDGSNLTRITHSGTFDAFPMFSYDGTKIAFSSNRVKEGEPTEETNVFVADWIENPSEVDKNFKTINRK